MVLSVGVQSPSGMPQQSSLRLQGNTKLQSPCPSRMSSSHVPAALLGSQLSRSLPKFVHTHSLTPLFSQITSPEVLVVVLKDVLVEVLVEVLVKVLLEVLVVVLVDALVVVVVVSDWQQDHARAKLMIFFLSFLSPGT